MAACLADLESMSTATASSTAVCEGQFGVQIRICGLGLILESLALIILQTCKAEGFKTLELIKTCKA